MQRCQDCIGRSYESIPPSSVLPHTRTHLLCEIGDLPVCHLGNTDKQAGRLRSAPQGIQVECVMSRQVLYFYFFFSGGCVVWVLGFF